MVNPDNSNNKGISSQQKTDEISRCCFCGRENSREREIDLGVVPPNPDHRSIFERTWLKMAPEIHEDDDGIEAQARALADEENEAWDEQEEEWT